MKKLVFSLTLTLLLLMPAVVQASIVQDTLTYGGYPSGITDGHYYVGNANGKLASAPSTTFYMWCIDAVHELGQNPWPVNVAGLNSVDLAGNPLGLSLTQFQAMAILGSQFTNTAQDAKFQQAIWNFTNPSLFTLTPAEQALQTSALASVNNYTYGGVWIFFPRGVTNQAFMAGTIMPTPEPQAMLLVGSALLLVGMRLKRRF